MSASVTRATVALSHVPQRCGRLPAVGSDEAFLSLDRNLNGAIDDWREIFGDKTPQPPADDEPNGWLALAVFDDPLSGGNGDGRIDAGDEIYSSLQLWMDSNHNGYSETEELYGLADQGVVYLDLGYRRAERRDQFGNQFKFWSKVGKENGGVRVAYDVFFTQE